jgi:RNA polymerase sigma-70 factor (ECF subfamily)
MDNIDQIIAKILAGDPDRYREVVETYESRVRAVVAAMVPDPNVTADVTQEVFVIAYQRLADYKPGTNFLAWLRTISRNVAQNERRRWYRRREMEARYEVEVAQQVEPHVDRLLEDLPEDLLSSLQDCVTHLQGKAREMMDGFYFKEHSIQELAKLLDISANAAKVVLHRARHAVGSCIQKKGRCAVE